MSREYEAEERWERQEEEDARLRAENVALAAEVQRLRVEVAARDALEAWRLADPEQRTYRVETLRPARSDDSETVCVHLYEYCAVRSVHAYDRNRPDYVKTPDPETVYAGKGCGVNAVIAAALERWRELHERGAT